MANRYTYHDANTSTRCSRKVALAFLIAQNGGEVRRNGVRHAWIMPSTFDGSNPYMCVESRNHKGTDYFIVTTKMRENARQLIGTLTPRKYYLIDFVYTDNDQQFGTGADLNATEVEKLEAYLQKLVDGGYITDPHVHEPGSPVHQSYAQARREIAAAIRS